MNIDDIKVVIDGAWEEMAQKYLSNVFFRRETDAKASRGDKFSISLIAAAYRQVFSRRINKMSIKSIHPDLRWVLIFMCVGTMCICAALLLHAFPASSAPLMQWAALGMAVLIILVGRQISICADA